MIRSDVLRLFLSMLAIALMVQAVLLTGGKVEAEAHPLWALAVFIAAVGCAAGAVYRADPDRRKTAISEIAALMIVFGLVTAVVYPIIQGARPAATSAACISATKMIGLAMNEYSLDYDDHLPRATAWRMETIRYGADLTLRCPDSKAPWTEAMNSAVSGKKLSEVSDPNTLVLAFEADAYAPDASGGSEWFVTRHNGRGSVCFASCNAKLAARPDLRWSLDH